MKEEIEKSCNLYPYFDYAFGYGVPQAAYFTGDLKKSEPLFSLLQEKDGIRISFKEIVENQYVFICVEGDDGVLLGYYQTEPKSKGIELKNKDLGRGKNSTSHTTAAMPPALSTAQVIRLTSLPTKRPAITAHSLK